MARSVLSIRSATFALLLFGVACAHGPQVQTEVLEREDGVVVVDTLELEATVTAIDARSREIRLRGPRGKEETFVAGEEMVNFGQVRVGDRVRAVVIESTAVQLIPGGTSQVAGSAEAVVLAPEGAKPGGVVVDAVEVMGTVVAIDGHEHTLTVRFADGTVEELQVGKHRDLSRVALGDSLRFRMTDAVAISVEPAEAR